MPPASGFINASPNSTFVSATPIASLDTGSLTAPVTGSRTKYGPPMPTNALTPVAPIFSTDTFVVVVDPSGVMKRSSLFSIAKRPATKTNSAIFTRMSPVMRRRFPVSPRRRPPILRSSLSSIPAAASPKVPLRSRSRSSVQSSAGIVAFGPFEPRLNSTESVAAKISTALMPVSDAPLMLEITAIQRRASLGAAGLTIASARSPLVSEKPMPLNPTKTFLTVSASVRRFALVRSATSSSLRSTSIFVLFRSKSIVPLTKPKRSIVAEPFAWKKSESYSIACETSFASLIETRSSGSSPNVVPVSSPRFSALVQSSASIVPPTPSEPLLISISSFVSSSVRLSTPVRLPPVMSELSANHERLSLAAAGLTIAMKSAPLVMWRPMLPGAPTKRSSMVKESSASDASSRSPVGEGLKLPSLSTSTSAVRVSNEKPTVPLTKPKMSIVTLPTARTTSSS